VLLKKARTILKKIKIVCKSAEKNEKRKRQAQWTKNFEKCDEPGDCGRESGNFRGVCPIIGRLRKSVRCVDRCAKNRTGRCFKCRYFYEPE
jgi:hypothetical protein